METGLTGFDEVVIPGADDPDPAVAKAAVVRRLGIATPDRLLAIAQAFRHGLTVEEIVAACSYEPWFLRQIEEIVLTERALSLSLEGRGIKGEGERATLSELFSGGASRAHPETAVGSPPSPTLPPSRGKGECLRKLKADGFSDARLAKLTGQTEAAVRALRHA